MEERTYVKAALTTANLIQKLATTSRNLLPSEVSAPRDQPVLPHSLFDGAPEYVKKIVFQINQSYTGTCYDACAVMIRRLVEVLIIEAFEHGNMAAKIIDSDNNYYRLEELVRICLAEASWRLGRNTKKALSKLKQIGDLSAHSRRYNARKQYIDEVITDLRVSAEDFLYLSGLK